MNENFAWMQGMDHIKYTSVYIFIFLWWLHSRTEVAVTLDLFDRYLVRIWAKAFIVVTDDIR
jgi:hypothetical protein